MKKIIYLTITALFILGCSVISTESQVGSGSMILKLDSELSRTIEPTITMEIANYDIEANGPNTDAFSELNITDTAFVKNDLSVGAWSITVNAKNNNGDIIASATQAFSITDGITTDVDLLLTPLNGTGELNINISWPIDELVNPSLNATLTPLNDVASDLSFTIENNTASFTSIDIETGYYTLSIQLLDDSEYVWGMVEVVRIINNEISSATLNLTHNDLNNMDITPSGNLSLNVTSDLQNPLNLVFSGDLETLLVGGEMIVTVNPSLAPNTYHWYLNGAILSGESNSSITIGSTLLEGNYRLDVVLKHGNILSSGNINFTVTNELTTKNWVETKVTASDGVANDHFGSSTSISHDGMTMVSGMAGSNLLEYTHTEGAFYIYQLIDTEWLETKKVASDGDIKDFFGHDVSISANGNTIISGARGNDDLGNNSGSIYIYNKFQSTWAEEKLLASDGEANDYFGISVSTSNDGSIIVATASGANEGTGSVYVFKWESDSWNEIKIVASDGALGDTFGRDASISSDGGTIIVGSPNDNVNGYHSGSIYIYKWNGTIWDETKIVPSDGSADKNFGTTVSISADGDSLVAGHFNSSTNNEISSFYLYKWDGLDWIENKFMHSSSETNDMFGNSLSISADGNTIISGASGSGDYGSYYMYKWNGISWTETQTVPSDGDFSDYYGNVVSISGDGETIVSSSFDDDIGTNSGSIYVYK